MDAEYATMSIKPAAYVGGTFLLPSGSMARSTDCAIGNIIAVVAVLLIHADSVAVVRPRKTKARENAIGDAFVQLELERGAGQQKTADEEHDDRAAEGRERLLRRGDTDDDRECRADECGHGQRQGLRDPQGADHHQDCRQTPPLFRDAGQREGVG
jgi:hypothetical protein